MRKTMARAWILAFGALGIVLHLALPQSAAAEPWGGLGESAVSGTVAQAAESGAAGGGLGKTLDAWTSEAGRIARERAQNDPVHLLRQRITACWTIPGGEGIERLKAVIRFGLDAQGKFSTLPEIAQSSGNAQYDTSALHAVRRCGESNKPLPEGTNWSQINMNFDAAGSM